MKKIVTAMVIALMATTASAKNGITFSPGAWKFFHNVENFFTKGVTKDIPDAVKTVVKPSTYKKVDHVVKRTKYEDSLPGTRCFISVGFDKESCKEWKTR